MKSTILFLFAVFFTININGAESTVANITGHLTCNIDGPKTIFTYYMYVINVDENNSNNTHYITRIWNFGTGTSIFNSERTVENKGGSEKTVYDVWVRVAHSCHNIVQDETGFQVACFNKFVGKFDYNLDIVNMDIQLNLPDEKFVPCLKP